MGKKFYEMDDKLDDKRFEAFYLEYQRRKQRTDKEVIQDLTEFSDDDSCHEYDQDEFVIEPFEKKEEWHDIKFDKEGHLVLQKGEEEEEADLIRDRVEKVIIDPFSLTDEMKHCKFDPNGNFIPIEENNEEEEEEENNEGENEIEFDIDIAIESLRYLILMMNHSETVSQAISRYEADQLKLNELTIHASQLQFMGLENIYKMKRKQIGKEYNQLLEKASEENFN